MDMSILEAQADVLFGNVAGWEQSVLNRIAKRIKAVGKMSVADVKALNNIAFVKQDMKEIIKDLAKMTKMNVSQIEKIYGDTLAQQHLENSPLYDYRNKKFVPFADNKELQSIVRAYSKTTAGNMVNLSKIGANNLGMLDENGKFKPIERFYTDALDKAVMQVASGSTDFHTAMRDVIQAMGGSGIRVSYPGTDITRRLDTAVRQSLLWGAKQASIEYNEMIGEELGCDGIEVDWHSFPRPSHEFMQGKQYVLGKSRRINGVMFESADDALRALNDYGCLHYKTPIICGISKPRYSEQELADLNKRNAQTFEIDGKQMTGYEAKQAMRRLETGVREQKTTREVARNAGDKVLADRCTAKIKAYQAKYNEICDLTGMSPQPKRMSIPKGLNSVNVNANKTLTTFGKSVKIDLQFFAEKDIANQSSNSIKRAMRKYSKKISLHQDKINNPQKYVDGWESKDAREKSGLVKHWQKEIRNFQISIDDRIAELKKRGDYDE